MTSVERCGWNVSPSFNLHLSSVRAQQAGQHVHRRALTRAILANQGVDFALAQLKTDAIKRDRRAKSFLHIGEREMSSSLSRSPVRMSSRMTDGKWKTEAPKSGAERITK